MKNLIYCLLGITMFTFTSLHAKTIYYVTATGTGDGSSWANAASNIQSMIDKAVATDEVWVAKGTYYPTTETIARDARSKTFMLKDGVNYYGGFAGTESAINQRVLADLDSNGEIDSCELVNSTILSGNIDGVTDVWTKTMNTDGKTWKWSIVGNEGNSYGVVIGGTSNTFFNGFTIIGGNANGGNSRNGGGITSLGSISNCTVSNCSAIDTGGGIYSSSFNSSLSSVTNCTISNCSARYSGGGIYIDSWSYSSARNCTVSNCSASNGGGIYLDSPKSTASFTVDNCTLSNCSASTSGGGIYLNSTSTSSVTNCTILNSSASVFGGGIYSTSSTVFNSRVSNCSAGTSGGGIYSSATYSNVTNCTVSNCLANTSGGGIYCWYTTNCVVSNCSSNSVGIINSMNCALSNNSPKDIIGNPSTNISPNILFSYIQPTSFIGVATTDAQKIELLNANWRLKEGSPCINSGTSTRVTSPIHQGNDFDGNLRVQLGTIDIGAYEYSIPKISLPAVESFNNWTDYEKSEVFYRSKTINVTTQHI